MARRGVLAGLGLIVLSLLASSLMAFGQGAEVTVSATLRIASSCLSVSPTTVDFGTLELTQPAAVRSAATPSATATVTVRNCSSQPETILVRGRAVTAPGVAWSHAPAAADVCAGLNLFAQGVRDGAAGEKRLTVNDQILKSLSPGAAEPVTLTLVPPCSGSTGAGQAITVAYIFTATLGEQRSR
ncbi:MAG: hypothetical protein ACRDJE_02945 [Dehalococcoidia bacterium]